MRKTRTTGTAALLAAVALAGLVGGVWVVGRETTPRFEVELTAEAGQAIAALGLEVPVTGRIFVVLTRDSTSEPREQVDVTGVPFYGLDVRDLAPGMPVLLGDETAGVEGYPLARIADLPPGEYYVQAFLNVYTTYHRADGRTLEMHHETGEGQNLWRSPGNAYSAVQRVRLDPRRGRIVTLQLSRVIPPIEPVPEGGVLDQGNPQDGELVKFIKIRSPRVSEFWGRDMYIGANVLLPRDYHENPGARYPVIYLQGHFPGRRAPFNFSEADDAPPRARAFRDFWLSPRAPRVIAVTIRDANPYYDTSYSVNSANVGPYGDAIVEELIPELERRFRIIAEPWARVLAGGSTGGWEALAMQIFYPDAFGGAWGWCPDPVDFHDYQLVNIYQDANAYYADHEWLRVERPSRRFVDGNVDYTIEDENAFERVSGPNGRSGGQWAIWEAVFGPVGPDGYAAPIWDPVTGEIDRETAAYWREHYDLTDYLRRNWKQLGPKLTGKLHVTVGDMDDYYLNEAVYRMQAALDSLSDPPARATFEYGRRKGHCWIGHSRERPGEDLGYEEFVRIAAGYMARNAPPGADVRWAR